MGFTSHVFKTAKAATKRRVANKCEKQIQTLTVECKVSSRFYMVRTSALRCTSLGCVKASSCFQQLVTCQ
eukprot:2876754-Amphidinium_carterae.1